MAYLQCGPGNNQGYYGGNTSATDCYEYNKHQEAGYMAGGGQYGHQPHHHHNNNYSGGNTWTETDRITECRTQQAPMPYGYNSTAGYNSGYNSHGPAPASIGQALIGTLLGAAKSHSSSQHTRRRRVRKQYPSGEYYSCSESESDCSDDEGRRGRRMC